MAARERSSGTSRICSTSWRASVGARPLAKDLLEVRERPRRVAEVREEQRPEPLVEVEPLVAGRALAPALEELREAVPPLLGGVERVERAHGLLVHRVELEDALVVADGLRAGRR